MKIKSFLVIVIMLAGFCLFSYFNTFEGLEYSLQDTVLQTRSPIDSRIVIIGIDDTSLEKLGQWPWPRTYIADAINILSDGKPSAIGVDIIYSEETRNPEEDEALIRAVQSSGKVVMPVYGDFGYRYIKEGKVEALNIKEPFPQLKKAVVTGHINNIPDTDNVVRRYLTSFDYKGREIKSFVLMLYDMFLKSSGVTGMDVNMPRDGWNRSFIAYAGQPGDFEVISFYKILNGEIPPEYFKDKIVLIGPYTVGLGDFYTTPMNHGMPMYGVEMHANIMQGLINNEFKQNSPDIFNICLLIILGLAGYFIFKKLSPAKSAVLSGIIIAVYIFAARYAYGKGYILQLTYPVALVFTIHIAVIAEHYIEEYLEKKRVKNLFSKYVSPQVVNKILEGGEESLKLGGIRREVTVLFVDIRGFTPLSEKCQPEEVVDILNQYLNLTSKSIFDNNGMLDKFIGDATMALFNAPLDLEDHALKAVKAAWEMQQGSELLQKALKERFGRTIEFGIGINTGYAVVGNIGSKSRLDYTAIGDTVNTAARLESNAKPGQILLGESTYEIIKDNVNASCLGQIKVKGKEQGLTVYQLEGVR